MDLIVVGPGNVPTVAVEGLAQQLLQGLGPGHLLQTLHPFLVLQAILLHLLDGRVAGLPLLGLEYLPGILQGGLDHGEQVHVVIRILRIQQLQGGQQEGRKGLVQGEVLGQVHGREVVQAAVGVPFGLDDPGVGQGLEDLVGPVLQMLLLLRGLTGVLDQVLHPPPGIPALVDLVEDHGVGDLQVRRQGLGTGFDQLVEGPLAPGDEPLLGLLAFDPLELLGVVARLGHSPGVLYLVFGCLGHDQSAGVEAHASGPACDLVEFPGPQTAHPVAVELGQSGQQDRVDGHVDADPQGVRATDDRQKAILGQLLHQTPVPGQHARMVDPDPGAQQPLQNPAEGRGEAGAGHGLLDPVALAPVGDPRAGQGLGRLQGGILGEMNDIDRRIPIGQQGLHGVGQWGVHITVVQRHRSRGIGDDVHTHPGFALQILGDLIHVAQGGRHEQELHIGQGQQGHLPGPASVRVPVIVELIHGHAADVGVPALPQGLVGQDLGRAADDRGIRVDVGVAGDHANTVAAQNRDQVEELLGDQGLDGSRVIGAPPCAQGDEMHGQGHHGLARAGRGRQDHMVA